MITKKDVPLALLKIIEPNAQANLDLIQFNKENNTYYCFTETDNNSKNFFKIFIDGSKIIGSYDNTKFTLEYKPENTYKAERNLSQTTLAELEGKFQSWIKLIRDIHETASVHDDNFVIKYAEFYYNEFKIVDEDVCNSPFNPDQQDFVEVYLLKLSGLIEQSTDKLTDTIREELLNDIQIIQRTLAISTKNQVMKNITKVFGKVYKSSKVLAKEIITEAKKYFIKKLIELGVEYAPKLLDIIIKY